MYKNALTRSAAYDWLEHICLEIGPRLSGSPQLEEAVQYTADVMRDLGLNTRLQAVAVPAWVRGNDQTAFFKSASAGGQLNISALGGSVATPADGIAAGLVAVSSFEELDRLGRDKIEGKIVLFNTPMQKDEINTFNSYGHCVKHRWAGASHAAKYGARAVLVRSLTLKEDNIPHTGSMKYDEGVDSIPAAAISARDAQLLVDLLQNDNEVEVLLKLDCKMYPNKVSHNVIGEIQGAEIPEQIILIGAHIDSWDVGHGAHDDGAGVVHCLGAVELLKQLNYKPRHTIRVVLFTNEENGLRGANEYATRYTAENHVAAIESDRGGFTPRGFFMEGNSAKMNRIKSWKPLLEPYGLHQFEEGGTGADIKPLLNDNIVLLGFAPDSQRYFDHHHAPTDVFESVNKRELELGVASIASMIYLIDKYTP
ncbi:MAG: M28 family peptidase [Salibacteraceae bacterium]